MAVNTHDLCFYYLIIFSDYIIDTVILQIIIENVTLFLWSKGSTMDEDFGKL